MTSTIATVDVEKIHEIFSNIQNISNQDILLQKLQKKCPMSLAVTTLLINNSSKRTLKECLEIEYRLSQKMVNRHDFGEGIDAVLIEKHNKNNLGLFQDHPQG